MAKILVMGERCTARLSEPDDDGDYGWTAGCGSENDAVRPIDEAVANAENHVDLCGQRATRRRRE